MNKRNMIDNSIFFEEIYKKADFFNLKHSVPSIVTSEDNHNFYIKVIPSETDPENFSVKIENRSLIISQNTLKTKNEFYEKELKNFEKTLKIPDNSDINSMESKFFNGIFILTIPKSYCFVD
jgi:HSP20 family molecular chaperone IbpA